MYPQFNRPDRPLAGPPGITSEDDYGMAPSMIRDMQRESRIFPPRVDGAKRAAQPVPGSDQVFVHVPTNRAYWSGDHHNRFNTSRHVRIVDANYQDETLPYHEKLTHYHH